MIYQLLVNGRRRSIDAWDPGQPLLYALRDGWGSRPEVGCGLGQCGACTVLVDDSRCAPAWCRSPARRPPVTTLEGLGTPKPTRVQAAFIAEQAAQCGYCTNGMIMAAKALLAQTPKPTLEQVKQGLAGNLCRCGTHTRILRAVMRAARA